MGIKITAMGIPNQTMKLSRDDAHVLMEALALVLGATVEFDFYSTEDDAEIGSIAVQYTH